MKSSSSIVFVVCMFVGFIVVPYNCEEAKAIASNVTTSATEAAITPQSVEPITTQTPDNTTPASSTSSTPSTPTTTSTTKAPDTTSTAPDTSSTAPDTSSTAPDKNTTTSTPKPTTTIAPTTSSTTTLAPNTTTVAPSPTPTPAPTPTTTPSPKPTPASCGHFDGPSFIGGIVLTVGLLAIGLVAYKFYKARNERNYHTL